MFKLSVKNCYIYAKPYILLMLIGAVLGLFKYWFDGKRFALVFSEDPMEELYERQVLEDEARAARGLGAGGAPAAPPGGAEEPRNKYGMNVYLSDRISYTRTIKDVRHPACARAVYDAELPSASVVIAFNNEPLSVVLRTVWSVLTTARRDRPWHRARAGQPEATGYPGQDPGSEHVYLQEIILVDDHSTLPELRGKLAHYVRTRLPRGLVRLLRRPNHEELTLPLVQIGGFSFSRMDYAWIPVPAREWARRGAETAPTWTPTMAGGLFALSRAYYWRLGGYDEGMYGWGGENLEMSFRVWQCGGTLETIPCARVGHVFRYASPHEIVNNSFVLNTFRMAAVWMDEYAELLHLRTPALLDAASIGDLSARRALRARLRCRSFQWFLDTVFPDKFVPVADARAFGRVRNAPTDRCLDMMRHEVGLAYGLYPCMPGLSPTQTFSLTFTGQLRDEENCVELQRMLEPGDAARPARALYVACDARERGQVRDTGDRRDTRTTHAHDNLWEYSRATLQLRHVQSGLCLDARVAGDGDPATARACADGPEQRWTFDFNGTNTYSGLLEPDVEARLRGLLGRRRGGAADSEVRPWRSV